MGEILIYKLLLIQFKAGVCISWVTEQSETHVEQQVFNYSGVNKLILKDEMLTVLSFFNEFLIR